MSKVERVLKDGDHVVYFDEHQEQHDALVTRAWSDGLSVDGFRAKYDGKTFCVNLTYVIKDPDMRDTWGQQTKHEGSVTYGGDQSPARLGRCWVLPEEA